LVTIELLRHAEPQWVVDDQGVDDPELSKEGLRSCERICDAYSERRFDWVYSSPMKRALRTAEPIARQNKCEIQVLCWLAELGHPTLEGKDTSEVKEIFNPGFPKTLEEWFKPRQGEAFDAFRRRVFEGIETLLGNGHKLGSTVIEGRRLWTQPEEDLDILVVSHGGTSSMLLCYLLDCEPIPWAWERFGLGWADSCQLNMSAITSEASIWSLATFNGLGRSPGLRPIKL
jgi:broad specificity phosphatase PhoE